MSKCSLHYKWWFSVFLHINITRNKAQTQTRNKAQTQVATNISTGIAPTKTTIQEYELEAQTQTHPTPTIVRQEQPQTKY